MSNSSSTSRTTQTALGRRSKNSRTIRPILALEINKKRVTKVALDPFDLPLLAMALFDTIILCMGNSAEKGARMSDLYRGLTGPIRAMDPGADQNTIETVTDYLVQELGNTTERQKFRDRYFDPAAGEGGAWVDFTFHLIEEVDVSGQETYRWIAHPEAINLYFQSLDIDLQAAEVAQAAVIKHFVDQGRWREAGDAAERAGKLSVGLKNELLTLLENLERNAADVDYRADLQPKLAQARQHLKNRIATEYDLIARAEEASSGVADEDRVHIRRLRDFVRMAMEQHQELEHHLAGANDRFVAEQTSQRFRPVALLRFRDPISEIIRPLLASRKPGLDRWFEENRHFYLPAVSRRMGDLVTLAPLLLQDPRVVAESVQVDPALESQEFAEVEPFSEAEVERVEAFLAQLQPPKTLQVILAEARSTGLTAKERHLLVLRLVRYFGEIDERAWEMIPANRRLTDTEFYGDDLKLEAINE